VSSIFHSCGTCWMGRDATTSVTDPSGRVWGFDNLFVADASLMPTSSGVNPSLTIAALGLFVADQL
jgi:choline dehydrogenase-like flavoprotein